MSRLIYLNVPAEMTMELTADLTIESLDVSAYVCSLASLIFCALQVTAV